MLTGPPDNRCAPHDGEVQLRVQRPIQAGWNKPKPVDKDMKAARLEILHPSIYEASPQLYYIVRWSKHQLLLNNASRLPHLALTFEDDQAVRSYDERSDFPLDTDTSSSHDARHCLDGPGACLLPERPRCLLQRPFLSI